MIKKIKSRRISKHIVAAVQIFDQVTGAQMFGKHNLKLSNFNFITKSASLSNAIRDSGMIYIYSDHTINMLYGMDFN